MRLTGKQLKRVAEKLGYETREGRKHTVVIGPNGPVTTLPRGKVKKGTLEGILKRLGIDKGELERLL